MSSFPSLIDVACVGCGGEGVPRFRKCGWTIRRCADCRMLFVTPRPRAADVDAMYRRGDPAGGIFPDELVKHERMRAMDEPAWERDLDRIDRLRAPRSQRGALLDFGCGDGAFVRLAARRGWRASGIDIGEWTREAAGRYRTPLFTGSLEEAPFPPASFDVIYSTSTFEHLPDPSSILRRMRTLIRDGGILFLGGLPNAEGLPARLLGPDWTDAEPPMHLNFFTPRALRALARRSGFVPARVFSSGVGYGFGNLVFGRWMPRPPAPDPVPPSSRSKEHPELSRTVPTPAYRIGRAVLNPILRFSGLGNLLFLAARPSARE